MSRTNRVARRFWLSVRVFSLAADVRRLRPRACGSAPSARSRSVRSASSRSAVPASASASLAVSSSARQRAGRRHRPHAASAARQHVVPAEPRLLVGGQPPGPPDVALGRPGGEHRHRRVHPVAADEQLGHGRGRWVRNATCRQRERMVTSVVRGRRAEQPDRPGRRLLDRLEQGVAGRSVSRSASSTTITCQRPPVGRC